MNANHTHPFAAIIFDMDGTLVDSEIVWKEAETALFRDLGLDYTDEARQQIIGMRLDEMFTKLKRLYHLPQSVKELENDLVNRMIPLVYSEVRPKPGAQALIEYAAALGIPYCIASSSPMSIIKAVVDSQGWTKLIPHLFSADDVRLGKPAPDVYLYAAEKLGANPAECLALEDSATGARSAVAAGMTCYAIPDFHTKPEAFAGITPHIFASLHEVLAMLQA